MQDSPHGGLGDESRGDGSSSRVVVESFHTERRSVPCAADWAGGPGPVPLTVFYGGAESFMVGFGYAGGGLSVDVWTTEAGVEAIRDACDEALKRARSAREAAA